MYEFSFLFFIVGLLFGSFINVIAVRYRPEKFLFHRITLGGRSHCPHCHKQLRWFELLPLVSYVLQGGRCRTCNAVISWQYPLVELASGFIFLLPTYFYFYFQIDQHILLGDLLVWYYWFSAAWVIAGLLMIILSLIDWRLFLIPDEAVVGIGLAGLLIAALKNYYQDFFYWKSSFLGHYAELVSLSPNPLVSHLAAGAIGLLFFGAIFLATRGRGMGFGDVKLAGALGLLLGWPDSAFAFAFAFIIGAVIGVIQLARRKMQFREPIPFGPYLVAGAFITLFFGFCIVDTYFKLFGIF